MDGAVLSLTTAHLDLSYHFLFVCLSQSFDFTLTDDVAEVWNKTYTHFRSTHSHSGDNVTKPRSYR